MSYHLLLWHDCLVLYSLAFIFMLINRCGWHQTCPTENSDDLYEWHRWEKVEYKIDEETGKPKTQIEFVPHRGTRKDLRV